MFSKRCIFLVSTLIFEDCVILCRSCSLRVRALSLRFSHRCGCDALVNDLWNLIARTCVIAGRNLCGSAFGGWKSRRDLPKLVSSSIDSLDKYITHERKFSDINRALQLLSEPSAQCLRCVIKMGE